MALQRGDQAVTVKRKIEAHKPLQRHKVNKNLGRKLMTSNEHVNLNLSK